MLIVLIHPAETATVVVVGPPSRICSSKLAEQIQPGFGLANVPVRMLKAR
jgi:hypothetical protein